MLVSNKKSKNILRFLTPTNFFGAGWREGLLTGNGKIGLNVSGGAGREVIVVNDSSLFWQGNTGVLPDVSDKVKNISKNLQENRYREAETVLTDALVGKHYKPECEYPLPLCDIVFVPVIDDNVNDYFRQVNMETGEVQTEYKVKNIKYDRSVFVSRVNDYICYDLTSSGKKLNGSFTIELHDKANNRMPNYEAFDVDLQHKSKTDKDFIVFTCRNIDGTDFGCVARLICFGGTLTKNSDTFFVKNADELFVVAKTFTLSQKEKMVPEIQEELSNIKVPYDKFLKDSQPRHAKLIQTVDIGLNGKIANSVDEDLLALKTTDNLPLGLLEQLYVYGKFLFACSMGDKILPCGLFNGDYKAYRSKVENFVGLQRLTNFAFKSGLASSLKPIFERFFDNMDDYKKCSTRLFGCKGIFVPTLEAPDSGLPASVVPAVVMNYNVGAYIATEMYEYFLLTEDKDFMEKIGFEFLEQVGIFYEEFLKVNKTTNVFETNFGYSPFDTPANIGVSDNCPIGSNCVADFACAKHVFSMLNHLCVVFDKPQEKIEKWSSLLGKIPDFEVDKNGFLKEYLGNIFETNNKSQYIPHLFPYNIGLRPFEVKRDFDEIVANTVKCRFSNSFGKFYSGSLTDLALALCSCGDAGSGFEILCLMVKNFVTKNLTFASGDNSGMGVGIYEPWTSFGIDKNINLCACLQNMFVNSCKNNIYLFKNLPNGIVKGNVTNLILDNLVKVDLEFNSKHGILKLKLKAPKNTSVNLFLPKGFKRIKGVDMSQVDTQFLVVNNLSLAGNKVATFKIWFAN